MAMTMLLSACMAPEQGVTPRATNSQAAKPEAGFDPAELPGISGGDALALHTKVCGNADNGFKGWDKRLGDITKVLVASTGTIFSTEKEYSFKVLRGECSMVFGMLPDTGDEVLQGLARQGKFEPKLSSPGSKAVYHGANGTLIVYRRSGFAYNGKQVMNLRTISKSAQ